MLCPGIQMDFLGGGCKLVHVLCIAGIVVVLAVDKQFGSFDRLYVGISKSWTKVLRGRQGNERVNRLACRNLERRGSSHTRSQQDNLCGSVAKNETLQKRQWTNG